VSRAQPQATRDQHTTIQDLDSTRQSILPILSQAPDTTKASLARDLDEPELLLQQQTIEELDLHALRSGTTWREQGGANTGYFFRAIAEQCNKHLAPALHNPTTNSMTTTAEVRLQVAADYYMELYTPDLRTGRLLYNYWTPFRLCPSSPNWTKR
jgi:hypothetical protein